MPEDRLPERADLIEHRILPELREIAAEHGLVVRSLTAEDPDGPSRVIRLTWQGQTWMELAVRTGVRRRRKDDG